MSFSDGVVRDLDFAGVFGRGALAELDDPAFFAKVQVDGVAGTVSWPGGLDLDPDVLRGSEAPADGRAPRLIRQRRLRAAG